MALEGTLEDFSLADIFQLIGIQRKTGILTLKSSLETVTVTFHNGMVIGADTSPRKLEDRIGKVLVKTGLISIDQLKEALVYQEKTLQKIGFILVDQKFISRAELKEALQIQVMQVIYRLFRWNSGEYYFDQKAKVDPNSDESISPMSAESILMEGIHMIDEWPVIQKKIPHFDVVFRPLLQIQDVLLDEQENGNGSDKVRLSKDEESAFRLVNGKNSVAEIIESSKLGEFHTCKALYDLLERKIIEPVGNIPRAMKEPLLLHAHHERSQPSSWKFLYAILGLAIAVSLFFGITDPLKIAAVPFFRTQDQANLRLGLTTSRINLVDSAIQMHFHVNGSLPTKLDELVARHYLSQEDIVDGWARPFVYSESGDTYMLAGFTSDGRVDEHMKFQRTLTVEQKTATKQNATKQNTESSAVHIEN